MSRERFKCGPRCAEEQMFARAKELGGVKQTESGEVLFRDFSYSIYGVCKGDPSQCTRPVIELTVPDGIGA